MLLLVAGWSAVGSEQALQRHWMTEMPAFEGEPTSPSDIPRPPPVPGPGSGLTIDIAAAHNTSFAQWTSATICGTPKDAEDHKLVRGLARLGVPETQTGET